MESQQLHQNPPIFQMPYPPYQMSPMYAPPGAQSQFTQYPQYVGTHLNTPSPESGNSFPDSSSAKSNMTSTNQHVRPPPILTSPNDFLNWVKIYKIRISVILFRQQQEKPYVR